MIIYLSIALAVVVALQWLGSRVVEEIIRDQEKLINKQGRLITIYEIILRQEDDNKPNIILERKGRSS